MDQPPQQDINAELPPPTLSYHVYSLASQAMMMMGQAPDPQTGKPEVYLTYAKHVIDTIKMLEEKTQGNRTPEEISQFSQILHELRMSFVAARDAQAEKDDTTT